MTNEDTRPKTTEFQREDRELWETNKLVHKLEISWRIPKESKQSKVRQDRYCSTQKQKKKKKKTSSIFLQSSTHSREFSITHKNSRRTPPNLSLSAHCKQRSFAIPPHTTHTLSLSLSSLSLSLSPAPYGGKFKPEWGGY
jgi:hypothetical protein